MFPDLLEFLAVGLVVDACVSEKHPNAFQSSRICENLAGVHSYPSQCVQYLVPEYIIAIPFLEMVHPHFLRVSLLYALCAGFDVPDHAGVSDLFNDLDGLS